MRKKIDDTKKKGRGMNPVLAVLTGVGFSLVALLLLALVLAALILGGLLPITAPGLILSLGAGVCTLVGGRFAIARGEGQPILIGTAAAGLLCLGMIAICLGVRGEAAFHSQFIGTLLMILAGGALAGLMGKKKRKKKK